MMTLVLISFVIVGNRAYAEENSNNLGSASLLWLAASLLCAYLGYKVDEFGLESLFSKPVAQYVAPAAWYAGALAGLAHSVRLGWRIHWHGEPSRGR